MTDHFSIRAPAPAAGGASKDAVRTAPARAEATSYDAGSASGGMFDARRDGTGIEPMTGARGQASGLDAPPCHERPRLRGPPRSPMAMGCVWVACGSA